VERQTDREREINRYTHTNKYARESEMNEEAKCKGIGSSLTNVHRRLTWTQKFVIVDEDSTVFPCVCELRLDSRRTG